MMTNAESIIQVLKLTSTISCIPAMATFAAAAYLIIRDKPYKLKKEIYEIEHPAPKEPEPPKKRIIKTFVPDNTQKQLAMLLMQPNTGTGWKETGGSYL